VGRRGPKHDSNRSTADARDSNATAAYTGDREPADAKDDWSAAQSSSPAARMHRKLRDAGVEADLNVWRANRTPNTSATTPPRKRWNATAT
jgi:hypothetical protein